jgi:hypothetical protein
MDTVQIVQIVLTVIVQNEAMEALVEVAEVGFTRKEAEVKEGQGMMAWKDLNAQNVHMEIVAIRICPQEIVEEISVNGAVQMLQQMVLVVRNLQAALEVLVVSLLMQPGGHHLTHLLSTKTENNLRATLDLEADKEVDDKMTIVHKAI